MDDEYESLFYLQFKKKLNFKRNKTNTFLMLNIFKLLDLIARF